MLHHHAPEIDYGTPAKCARAGVVALAAVSAPTALAVEGVAQHLIKSWDPRMRRLMHEHVVQNEGADLHPLVALAVRQRPHALQ